MVITVKYYKLKIEFILNEDISFKDISTRIGISLQKSMYNQDKLKQVHNEKRYKYTFSPLIPFIMKKKYLKNEKYSINITSFDEELIVKFNYALNGFKNNYITVLNTKLNECNLNDIIITELEAITPVIVTVDNKPWVLENYSMDLLIQKIYDNLEKKYLEFFSDNIEIKSDFNKYSLFEKTILLNKKPIARRYKNFKLIGYKIKINIGTNNIAQKLAKTAIVMGLGEKNSVLGSGFVKYKKIRR